MWAGRSASVVLPESTHPCSIGEEIRVQIDVVQGDAPVTRSLRVMHQHLVISYRRSDDIIESDRIQGELAQTVGVLGVLTEDEQIQVPVLIVSIGMTSSHAFEKEKKTEWKREEKMNSSTVAIVNSLLIDRRSSSTTASDLLLLSLTRHFKSMYKALQWISACVNYEMRPERKLHGMR